MIVRKFIYEGQKPTSEQQAELDALRNMSDDDIICDEECPELTDEELSRMRPVGTRHAMIA